MSKEPDKAFDEANQKPVPLGGNLSVFDVAPVKCEITGITGQNRSLTGKNHPEVAQEQAITGAKHERTGRITKANMPEIDIRLVLSLNQAPSVASHRF